MILYRELRFYKAKYAYYYIYGLYMTFLYIIFLLYEKDKYTQLRCHES